MPAAFANGSASAASPRYQSYGTADLGLVAYETAAREGLVVDEGVVVEIVARAPATRSRRAKSASWS